MQRSEIAEKLLDVMKMAVPDFDEKGITEESDLILDLGLSSVGVLYIVIAIEEFFNVRFDDVGFGDFKTVGDVITYIEKKVED
jgi:acyl carrier protein